MEHMGVAFFETRKGAGRYIIGLKHSCPKGNLRWRYKGWVTSVHENNFG
jgi:hypothetical protein